MAVALSGFWTVDNAVAQRKLAVYDVVLVRVTDGKGKAGARAELRVRPIVQGAVVVLENKTGRILAMSGGFSYPLSQLNRTSQAMRQPGSAIKPLSYLAALGKGLQPNTLVMDQPITLPPIGGGRAREQDYWTPKNYDGGSGNTLTLRRALENSRNLATVRLLDGGIEKKPEASLNRLCDLAVEAQIYRECVRYYPFVLGAQPVRPIDLAAFYAAIANEGSRPVPYSVDSIDRDGQTIYRYQQTASGTISSVDRAAFYQLKTMMQGVLARGTAHAISGLAPYVAGKTGTSDDENDAWFVGFTNDVTVAVWLGYDNATGKRRTLGGGATGGGVAVPIFEPIIQAVWANVAPRAALAAVIGGQAPAHMQSNRPRTRARPRMVESPSGSACGSMPKAGLLDTQYSLVSRGDASATLGRARSSVRVAKPIGPMPAPITRLPLVTTPDTVGITTDDTLTRPISGEDHHNQIPRHLALTDTSGQIRFGATANLIMAARRFFSAQSEAVTDTAINLAEARAFPVGIESEGFPTAVA